MMSTTLSTQSTQRNDTVARDITPVDVDQLTWEHGHGWHIDAEDADCTECLYFGGTPSPSEMREALALRNRLAVGV
jgi:hypothetical protein